MAACLIAPFSVCSATVVTTLGGPIDGTGNM